MCQKPTKNLDHAKSLLFTESGRSRVNCSEGFRNSLDLNSQPNFEKMQIAWVGNQSYVKKTNTTCTYNLLSVF